MSRADSFPTRVGLARCGERWRKIALFAVVLALPACDGAFSNGVFSSGGSSGGASLGGAALGGASLGPTPGPATTGGGQAATDLAIRDACNQRTNEIYNKQNRAAIYSPQYGINSPMSGTYVDSPLTHGLSARFAHEQLLQECIRSANVRSSRADAPVENPEPVPPPPPPSKGTRR